MTATFYKATQMDGTDFYTGTVLYEVGATVTIPDAKRGHECCAAGVLHASVDPAATLVNGSWPCRLFQVEGAPVAKEGAKRGFHELRVVAELDAWRVFGPQGREVAALIERAMVLTNEDARRVAAAWGAVRGAVWDAARGAAWGAVRGAVWDAARGAVWDAARAAARDAVRAAVWALVVRDLIGISGFTQDHYDLLTRPWRTAIGPIHPHDADLREQVTA